MADLILHTFEWVPPPPRGFVRDLRVRWALEEAGLPYRIETVPFVQSFETKNEAHLAHQPFGQVPWLTDGDLTIFESGAILLHLGERSERLLPKDPKGRAEAIEWVFAALNSVEMATVCWSIFKFSNASLDDPGFKRIDDFVHLRLRRLEPALARREWVAGTFSVGDILMADVLRLVDRFGTLEGYPACRAYLQRATARPAFVKAHADQMAQFEAADRARAKQA